MKAKMAAMNGEINVRNSAPMEAMPDHDQKKAVSRIMSQPPMAKNKKKYVIYGGSGMSRLRMLTQSQT